MIALVTFTYCAVKAVANYNHLFLNGKIVSQDGEIHFCRPSNFCSTVNF